MSERTRINAEAATDLAAGASGMAPAERGRLAQASPMIVPEGVAAMWRPLAESVGVEEEKGDVMREETRNNAEAATLVAAASRLAPAGRLFLRLALVACVAALATALSAGAAMAQTGGGGFDPNALTSNLSSIAAGFILLIGIFGLGTCLYNRQTTAGIAVFVVCGIFAAVANNPDVMTSVGNWVFEQGGLTGGE